MTALATLTSKEHLQLVLETVARLRLYTPRPVGLAHAADVLEWHVRAALGQLALAPSASAAPSPFDVKSRAPYEMGFADGFAKASAAPPLEVPSALKAAMQRGADGVFDLLKDWHLINKDARANKRLWQIARNLEGIFGCTLRGDYDTASPPPVTAAREQEANLPTARIQAHFGLTEAQARSIVEGAHTPRKASAMGAEPACTCCGCGGCKRCLSGSSRCPNHATPTSASVQAEGPHPTEDALGKWLSAALEDPMTCAEMRADTEAWMQWFGNRIVGIATTKETR